MFATPHASSPCAKPPSPGPARTALAQRIRNVVSSARESTGSGRLLPGQPADEGELRRCVQLREAALARLLSVFRDRGSTTTLPFGWWEAAPAALCLGDSCMALLMLLRRVSLELVEGITQWQRDQQEQLDNRQRRHRKRSSRKHKGVGVVQGHPQGQQPVFRWNGENYLLRMTFGLPLQDASPACGDTQTSNDSGGETLASVSPAELDALEGWLGLKLQLNPFLQAEDLFAEDARLGGKRGRSGKAKRLPPGLPDDDLARMNAAGALLRREMQRHALLSCQLRAEVDSAPRPTTPSTPPVPAPTSPLDQSPHPLEVDSTLECTNDAPLSPEHDERAPGRPNKPLRETLRAETNRWTSDTPDDGRPLRPRSGTADVSCALFQEETSTPKLVTTAELLDQATQVHPTPPAASQLVSPPVPGLTLAELNARTPVSKWMERWSAQYGASPTAPVAPITPPEAHPSQPTVPAARPDLQTGSFVSHTDAMSACPWTPASMVTNRQASHFHAQPAHPSDVPELNLFWVREESMPAAVNDATVPVLDDAEGATAPQSSGASTGPACSQLLTQLVWGKDAELEQTQLVDKWEAEHQLAPPSSEPGEPTFAQVLQMCDGAMKAIEHLATQQDQRRAVMTVDQEDGAPEGNATLPPSPTLMESKLDSPQVGPLPAPESNARPSPTTEALEQRLEYARQQAAEVLACAREQQARLAEQHAEEQTVLKWQAQDRSPCLGEEDEDRCLHQAVCSTEGGSEATFDERLARAQAQAQQEHVQRERRHRAARLLQQHFKGSFNARLSHAQNVAAVERAQAEAEFKAETAEAEAVAKLDAAALSLSRHSALLIEVGTASDCEGTPHTTPHTATPLRTRPTAEEHAREVRALAASMMQRSARGFLVSRSRSNSTLDSRDADEQTARTAAAITIQSNIRAMKTVRLVRQGEL